MALLLQEAMPGHENSLFGYNISTHKNCKSLENYLYLSSISRWGREKEVQEGTTIAAGSRVQTSGARRSFTTEND